MLYRPFRLPNVFQLSVAAMRRVLQSLNIPKSEWLDPSLDLDNTPRRVVKMMRDELLGSYKPGALEALISGFTCFPSDGKDAMVVIGPIDFTSLCAHHVLPFSGEAFIGYIPGDVVVGASKLPRVVEHYSRMLQIQERMARQVADFVYDQAGAKLVIAFFMAKHECMRCRGVRQRNSVMATTAVRPAPVMDDESWRGVSDEFWNQVQSIKKG